MVNQVNLKEFVSGFILEADEHFHAVNQNLVAVSEALKQNKPEPRAVRELFRSFHTIKGLASMVGAEPIVDISHELESILRAADHAGGMLTEEALDLLLQGTRAIEERVRILSKVEVNDIPPAPKQLLEALALAQHTEIKLDIGHESELDIPIEITRSLTLSDREQMAQGVASGNRVLLIEFQPSPKRAANGINITSVRERLGKLGELIKVVPHSSPSAPTGISFFLLVVTQVSNTSLSDAAGLHFDSVREIKDQKPQKFETQNTDVLDYNPPSEDLISTEHSSIRVDIRRLDDALERLSALIVTRSKLVRVAADLSSRGADTRELNAVISENTSQLKKLRAAITAARMVPLAELLQRLPLIVRGLTKETDKSVNVKIQAGSAEVDKAVADKIFPAIVHLIRNAVDHGIETRSERKKQNKPETATLTLVCDDSSGTNLVLTLSDDGRGIDRNLVARKVGHEVAATSEELLRQIVTPGLSTRSEVTHTSGRGMGMDIVQRIVEMLGGVLSLSTSDGKGTTFTLRVPVSVTIVDVLSFESGGQIFVAPIAMVDEIIEIDPARIVKSPMPTKLGTESQLIQRRGDVIPFLVLEKILQPHSTVTISSKALVVNQHRGAIALGVDRMMGQQEVVVRPLDDAFLRVNGIVGATDLGDGRPTLVVDLASLGSGVLKKSEISI